jgi:pimeloyl-ACP methyl ester carboxylesterase
MADFVLVHGAWHGGWCWRRVVDALHAQGHRAFAVTLTGLGERAHLMSPLITLETHIADVANLLEAEELQDAVLAVHSYAGMIGTAIADRMPQRLKHLVYVDAVVPKPGESWSSTHASATREARIAAAQASPDFSFPPPDPSVFGLAAGDHDWVQRRQTPPSRPHLPGAAAIRSAARGRRRPHLRRLREAPAGHHRLDPPARSRCELLGRRLVRRRRHPGGGTGHRPRPHGQRAGRTHPAAARLRLNGHLTCIRRELSPSARILPGCRMFPARGKA